MFLHLGNDCVVRKSEIVGIFDIENTSVSKDTKLFLNAVSKKGKVVYVTGELPKSFVVCARPGEGQRVILSPLSPQTLQRRLENGSLSAGGS